MKRTKARLSIARETIRALKSSSIERVIGGFDVSERNCVAAVVLATAAADCVAG